MINRRRDDYWILGIIQLVVLVVAGLFFGTMFLARGLSIMFGGVLPPASSSESSLRNALVSGGVCCTSITCLAALSGSGDVAMMGFGFGAVVGSLVGTAIFQLGKAETAANTGSVVLGRRRGPYGLNQPFIVPREARIRHFFVDGPTGAGKTTLIQNLAVQDATAPQQLGYMVIDVKDNLIFDIADRLPAHRVNDIIIFDPADTAFPPAFNPLAGVSPEARTLAAGELLSALKRLYADNWGPRLEHVLRMVLLTLLETPDATLLDITRILTDGSYREWAVSRVGNFSVRAFWKHEFPAIVGTNGSVANVESILNKLGVLAYPEVRNVLGQQRRGLDLRTAMDEGKIVLAHLPQGVLGEDAAFFLAALLVGKVQLAAQSRVNATSQSRRPFYLFLDEFQNYQTSAMEKLITEGRSMQVGLVAACQFPEQVPAGLRMSLERNCAYALHCQFSKGRFGLEAVKPQDPDSEDGVTMLQPLPPPISVPGQTRQIRANSRTLLSRPRAAIETEIHRDWRNESMFVDPGNLRRRRL